MKKNFAAQPSGGGQIRTLTGLDLTTDVTPDQSLFQKSPNFIDNCKDCGMKKNFDDNYGYDYGYDDYYSGAISPVNNQTTTAAPKSGGGFFSGIDFGDILGIAKTGAEVWSSDQQRKSAQEQAQLALQIEQQRLMQERAKAQAEAAKSSSIAEKAKSYIIPIAVTGVVVIGGIAAYFYFKKKKIS